MQDCLGGSHGRKKWRFKQAAGGVLTAKQAPHRPGTAKTSGGDYVAKSGTLTFAPGETTKTSTIAVNGDNKGKAEEMFYLDLFGNSTNSLFTKSRGTGTILNDD